MRTSGLPQIDDDVRNRTEPLSFPAVAPEARMAAPPPGACAEVKMRERTSARSDEHLAFDRHEAVTERPHLAA